MSVRLRSSFQKCWVTNIPKNALLMRVHQHLFKTSNLNQLLKLSEDEKESFQVTFSGDSGVFENVRKEFRTFVARVEEIAQRSRKDERVLQLNFDLFHWY